MYKAVIFDLDGTLTDTLESMALASNKTLEYVGLKPRDIQEYRYFVGDGADVLVRRFLKAAGDTECSLFEKAYEVYMKQFAQDCTYIVKPYDGIVDMLEKLKNNGMKLAVLSNKPHLRAIEVIENFFEKNTFDITQGHSVGMNKKPDPTEALAIAKKLGIEPNECIYVGDTDVDMQTGKNAGMYTVGVLWGFRDEKELREHGADYIVSKPSDILKLLK
jgi:phosphoglycolate phosphatase